MEEHFTEEYFPIETHRITQHGAKGIFGWLGGKSKIKAR